MSEWCRCKSVSCAGTHLYTLQCGDRPVTPSKNCGDVARGSWVVDTGGGGRRAPHHLSDHEEHLVPALRLVVEQARVLRNHGPTRRGGETARGRGHRCHTGTGVFHGRLFARDWGRERETVGGLCVLYVGRILHIRRGVAPWRDTAY